MNLNIKERKTVVIDKATDIDVTLWEDGGFWIAIDTPHGKLRAIITADNALELAECLLDFAQLRNNQLKKQNNETN